MARSALFEKGCALIGEEWKAQRAEASRSHRWTFAAPLPKFCPKIAKPRVARRRFRSLYWDVKTVVTPSTLDSVRLGPNHRRDTPVATLPPKTMPWLRLLLHPAHSLPTAAAPILIACALAWHDGVFSWAPAALAFLSSWLVHVGGLYAENYWLLTRHAGLCEHPELANAVASGALSLTHLRRVTAGCYVLAAIPGACLVVYAGIMAPVLGAIGIAASVNYCAGRFSWTRLGVGEIVFCAMFGSVAVVGAYYCQAAQFFIDPLRLGIASEALPLRAFVLGLPLGAIISNVMLVDDLSDIAIDAAKGWRTRPVVWGVRWSRREYLGVMLVAYALPLWFWRGLGFGLWVLLPLASAPLAWWAIRRVYAIAPNDVEPMSPKTAGLGLLYAVLLGAGVMLSAVR